MKRIPLLLSVLLLGLQSLTAQETLHLARIFSDHMVLQRDQDIVIWGWSEPKERITVRFGDQEEKTRAEKDGSWRVTLDEMPAGGPYVLQVEGKKTQLSFSDVYMGDVWICSGQSNMQWPLTSTDEAETEVMMAEYDQIRLFTVERNIKYTPQVDLDQKNGWAVCNPQSASNFSAVAYYFGKKLLEKTDVPQGLIHTSWGGTEVETWISGRKIESLKGFEGVTKGLSPENQARILAAQMEQKNALLKNLGSSQGGFEGAKPIWAAPDLDESNWKTMAIPQLWEGAGLPNVDGIVWFRFTLELSPEIAARGGNLSLGPIDDSDITFVNGQEVGRTTNRYNDPRFYQVPAQVLKAGKNIITVRVEDTGGGGGMAGKAEAYQFQSGNFSVSLAGNWKYRVSPVDLKISSSMGPNSQPTLLYNGMIAPLIPYGIKGAIWYQGESNAGRAYEYRTLFPAMIQDWRERWDHEFPFLFVQLANFRQPKSEPGDSDWAELREAQSMTLSLPKTGQAVIIDIGEADDIHPRNKKDVGNRLAQSALHVAYEQDVVYSGPVFDGMKIRGDRAILSFEQVGDGLMAQDKYGYLKGFAIAGADKKWYWAQAYIDGNEVVVSSPQVTDPVAVRYGWADNPDDANLYNRNGLPASPFRTDAWPGITEGAHRTYPNP